MTNKSIGCCSGTSPVPVHLDAGKLLRVTSALFIACLSYSSAAYSACAPTTSTDGEPYIHETIECTGTDANGWSASGSWMTIIIYPGAVIGPINAANWNTSGTPTGGGGNEVYNYGTVSTIQVGPDNYVENHGIAEQITGYGNSTLINAQDGSVSNALSNDYGIFGSSKITYYDPILQKNVTEYFGTDVINAGSITMTGATNTSGMHLERNSLGTNESTGTILITGDDSDGMLGTEAVELHNQGSITVQGATSDGMFVVGDAIMDNSGTIVADGEGSGGIDLVGKAGIITNSGSISVTGTENYGISALFAAVGTSGETTLSITNDGSIYTDGFTTYGISVEDYDGAVITNNDSVEVNGIDAQGISVGGTSTTIQNSATGTVAANGADVYGIALSHSGQISNAGGITVNGIGAVGIATQTIDPAETIDIINSGSILATQKDSAAIGRLGSGAITNTASGDIRTEGDASFGIYNEPSSGIAVPIINNGTITTTGAESFGVNLLGEGSITNTGSINAEGVLSFSVNVQGDDSEIFNSSTGVILTKEVESVAVNVVGSRANVNNEGFIVTESSTSPGIAVQGNGCRGTVKNCAVANSNNINTSNAFSPGIAVIGSNHTVSNTGDISTGDIATGTGDESFGLAVVRGSNTAITQQGIGSNIKTAGARSHGIVMGLDEGLQPNLLGAMDSSTLTVGGGVETSGQGAYAINVFGDGNTITVDETASLLTTGDGSHGLRVKAPGAGLTKITAASNAGLGARIDTRGDDANGIHVLSDQSEILVQEDALISVGGSRSAAIYLESSGQAQIVNEGQLTAQGPDDPEDNAGIKALFSGNGAPDARTVSNLGQINTVGLVGTRGIDIIGDDVVVNNGSIAKRDVSIVAGDEFSAGSAGITVTGTGASVANEGSVSVAGVSATGIEIVAPSSGNFLLTSAGTITVESDGGIGMAFRSSTVSPITAGQANVANSSCVALNDGMADFINCGSIEMLDSDAATGMLARGINNTTIENQAAIAGNASVGELHGIVAETANNNLISNLDQITLPGDDSIGISVTGDSNSIINGTGEVAFPTVALDDPLNFIDNSGRQLFNDQALELISSSYSRALPAGDQIPQGDILITGANSVGISVDGNNNRIGIPTYHAALATVRASGAGSVGVRLSGADNLLVNGGDIRGDAVGIQGGSGNDSVVNLGHISGGVRLEAGDDVMVVSSNDIIGSVNGGVDTDALVVFVDPDLAAPLEISGSQYVNFEWFHKTGAGNMLLSNTLSVNEARIWQGAVNLAPGAILHTDIASLIVEQEGTLSGAGTVDGRVVVNGGIIAPGSENTNGGVINPADSKGKLSINGDLIINDGLLNLEIGGLEPGMFDFLDVSGDASIFGGNINFSFIDGYLPQEGDLFEFLLADNISGFENFSYGITGLPTGFDFDLTATNGGVGLFTTAAASAVPIPPSVWLFGSGLVGLISIARRKNRIGRQIQVE